MPAIDSSHYQHPLDAKTLSALKSVPGFTPLMKAFMKHFTERQFFIENHSTSIEITPHQLSEYYDMLPPICERLGIAVPRLYLCHNRSYNACTYGETNPFIRINSGLLEISSTENVRSIIAHECGHIVCKHTLYKGLARAILSGALAMLPGVGVLVSVALNAALLAWDRASEYSADRAAAIAMGGSDPVVSTCVEMAGGYSSLGLNIDIQAFMDQAAEYEQIINDSLVNRAFEFLFQDLNVDHPLNAYRALEIARWCATPEFASMLAYVDGTEAAPALPSQPAALQASDTEQSADQNQDASSLRPKFCTVCGVTISEVDIFCGGCGTKIG